MTQSATVNLAEQAAESALADVYTCIDEGKNFLLEAGAGAGKTETLIRSLRYIVNKRGNILSRQNQHIACITYTNVASNEIKTRTDSHDAIRSSTIHAFCWSLIKNYQPYLREKLYQLGDKWTERLDEAGGMGSQKIDYDLGYPKVDKNRILLGHNDVLSLTVALMEWPKFCDIFAVRYPVLFIDEYQDTNKEFAQALNTYFLDTGRGPLIGFFGDHWQKIYGDGCGKIDHPNLKIIGQKSNFRSVKAIVDVLNHIRPELPQDTIDPNALGSVAVYHTNHWMGERRTEAHWKGDLPSGVAHYYLEKLKQQLVIEGWCFSAGTTKILMLTHNVLAAEQGYSNLAKVFSNSEAYIKKEDPYIAFFDEILEPVCAAYKSGHFGEMFGLLGGRTPTIVTFDDKASWVRDMDALLQLRETENIGAILDHLVRTKRPRLTEYLEQKQTELNRQEHELSDDELSSIERLKRLRDINYREVVALTQFIDGHTLFSTKHGVKGAGFENVIVVVGRGWNHYDFNQMLELAGTNLNANQVDAFERNRNLFYVACSRPQKRLALLFTQRLTELAIKTLARWFGEKNIHDLVRT